MLLSHFILHNKRFMNQARRTRHSFRASRKMSHLLCRLLSVCTDCTNAKVWFKICSTLNSGYSQVLTPLSIRTLSPEKGGGKGGLLWWEV